MTQANGFELISSTPAGREKNSFSRPNDDGPISKEFEKEFLLSIYPFLAPEVMPENRFALHSDTKLEPSFSSVHEAATSNASSFSEKTAAEVGAGAGTKDFTAGAESKARTGVDKDINNSSENMKESRQAATESKRAEKGATEAALNSKSDSTTQKSAQNITREAAAEATKEATKEAAAQEAVSVAETEAAAEAFAGDSADSSDNPEEGSGSGNLEAKIAAAAAGTGASGLNPSDIEMAESLKVGQASTKELLAASIKDSAGAGATTDLTSIKGAPSTSKSSAARGAGAPMTKEALERVLVKTATSRLTVLMRLGLKKATITLTPPELGKMKIDIEMKDNIVKAVLKAENPLVKETLEANIATLKSSLEAQGLSVDEIIVEIDAKTQQNAGGELGGGDKGAESRRSTRGLLEDESDIVPPAATQATGDAEVDLFI